jgi:TetR/AcrR family transcriptional regulator, regulator of cefoperazone and chloramphenicol sensitivity
MDSSQAGTRERLLEAAGEVFAEKGFRRATIRDICQRAGSNVAAVNYHFGDKERLYAEVLHYAHHCADAGSRPADAGLAGAPEEQLREFIKVFLFRIFNEGRPAWHARLMVQEIFEPTVALDQLVNQAIRPQQRRLAQIVRDIVGPVIAEKELRLCVISIVAQCLHYHHARPVITRLYPEQTFLPADIDAIAEHIARFSLAALKHLPPRAAEVGL